METDQAIGSLSDFYGNMDGYQHLKIDVHELIRMAEVSREKAGMIEDRLLRPLSYPTLIFYHENPQQS